MIIIKIVPLDWWVSKALDCGLRGGRFNKNYESFFSVDVVECLKWSVNSITNEIIIVGIAIYANKLNKIEKKGKQCVIQ